MSRSVAQLMSVYRNNASFHNDTECHSNVSKEYLSGVSRLSCTLERTSNKGFSFSHVICKDSNPKVNKEQVKSFIQCLFDSISFLNHVSLYLWNSRSDVLWCATADWSNFITQRCHGNQQPEMKSSRFLSIGNSFQPGGYFD